MPGVIASRTNLRIRRDQKGRRRGVASILSMMFLVIFGSLAAVMAVVAQGNLRTADSYLKVTRATSAAEQGMIFARRRLAEQSRRFVVTKGVVDEDFGEKLWFGSYTATDGTVTVLPPDGFTESPPAVGIVEALRNAHMADGHNIEVTASDALLPSIDEFGTLRVKPVGEFINGRPGVHFRLKYELLEDERFVRVTSQGVDGEVSRTIQMDFEVTKKIRFAVISPNRVMIGKNVRIEGPLGTRYGVDPGELDPENGNPLVMRSDFYHLDATLDSQLDDFFALLPQYDVDDDGRLRINHPIESSGMTEPFMIDYDGNEYVDDFDLFLAQMDTNGDGMVVYDEDLAMAAGYTGLSLELTQDEQLGHLIDFGNEDRNVDGLVNAVDLALGRGDGVIDARDFYTKVAGELAFAVGKEAWESARGGQSFQAFVQGPIRPDSSDAPAVTFDVAEEDLLDITTADFANAANWFKDQARNGPAFADQVASSGGEVVAKEDAPWETVPFGAKGYYDWYQRPIYRNMTFTNVEIPAGTNALFENCTFVGVTYIRSHEANDDINWNYVGMVDKDFGSGAMEDKYPGLTVDVNGTEVSNTRDYSNNIRFHDCTFAGSVVSDTTSQYTHVRNKVQFTGSTRFTLDHPDLTPEEIKELEKTSIFMPGYSVDVGDFTNSNTTPVELKGTIICGVLDARGAVDVHGTVLTTYRPAEGQGPLFYGGTPDGFNTTIGYFGPDDGDAESVDPSKLTDTDADGIKDIGIDLDNDGVNDPFQGFGEITLRYNPDAKLPDGIPWPVSITPVPGTYVEGGSM